MHVIHTVVFIYGLVSSETVCIQLLNGVVKHQPRCVTSWLRGEWLRADANHFRMSQLNVCSLLVDEQFRDQYCSLWCAFLIFCHSH